MVAALRAGRRQFPVYGLTSIDVTDVVAALQAHRPPLSLTAHVVAAVGRAVAAHPQVAAYRNWWGRLVVPHFVDVATLIEVESAGGSFPLAHVLHDVDVRDVGDLSAELRQVKERPTTSGSGRLLKSAWLARLPLLFDLGYFAVSRSPRLRVRAGTVTVTSVGMFGGGGGFALGLPTIMTLNVLVGGMSDRPVVHDGAIAIRTMLDVTVSVDHHIVDGAPAARFAAALRDLIATPPSASITERQGERSP